MTGIYSIHNIISDKYYIGQSGDIEYRWIQHKSRLRCGVHENKHLQSSYDIYGEYAFKYDVVTECLKEDLNDREKFYIKEYDSYHNGYNQDEGGAGCSGYKHTEEELLKMRTARNPRAVLQLDKDLNIIAEWLSSSHAGKILGFSIRQIKACCNRENRQKTTNGFYFVYKDEYENGTIDWDYYLNINEPASKRVSQYSIDMKLIKIYDSAYQAAKQNKFCITQIVRNYQFKSQTAYNFIWRLTDEYTDEQFRIDCEKIFKPTMNNVPLRISQYDLNMNLVKIWDSLNSIKKETGWSAVQIVKSCESPTITSHNFVWRYADTYTDEEYQRDLSITFKETKNVESLAVLQYTLDGKLIMRYTSKQKAGKATNLSPSTIHNRCIGKTKNHTDFIFKYERDVLISQ